MQFQGGAGTGPLLNDGPDITRLKILEVLNNGARNAAGVGTGPNGTTYETVAASQTAQVLGGSGASGDYLTSVLIIPATTSPGAVTILDGATSIPIFVGGTTTVQPFLIPLGIRSVSGAWKVTTGSNVSVIATGSFT